MTHEEILNVFTRVLRDLMDDESILLTMETRRQDVPQWDSFAYVNFIAAIEIELKVKFRLADVESFENVGAIVTQTKEMLR